MKICSQCKIAKELTEFRARSRSKDGHSSECRSCHNLNNRKWADKNRDKARSSSRRWHLQNKGKSKVTNKLWLLANYQRKQVYIKKWNAEHPDKVKEMRDRGNRKMRSTEKGRLNDAFSSAIYRSLKEAKGNRRWESLVGYTVEQLMAHIEKQFKPGMSWGNYGKFTWHIDHIIPVVAFNFDSPDCIDFKRCWALSNLRPLEAKKNHSKNDKLAVPFQPSLLVKDVVNG